MLAENGNKRVERTARPPLTFHFRAALLCPEMLGHGITERHTMMATQAIPAFALDVGHLTINSPVSKRSETLEKLDVGSERELEQGIVAGSWRNIVIRTAS